MRGKVQGWVLFAFGRITMKRSCRNFQICFVHVSKSTTGCRSSVLVAGNWIVDPIFFLHWDWDALGIINARNKCQIILCFDNFLYELVAIVFVFFNHRLKVKVSWKTWIMFSMLVMFQTSSPRMSWIPSSQPWNQWFLILGCSQPKLTYIQLLQNAWEPTPTLLFVWGEEFLNPLSDILTGPWSSTSH